MMKSQMMILKILMLFKSQMIIQIVMMKKMISITLVTKKQMMKNLLIKMVILKMVKNKMIKKVKKSQHTTDQVPVVIFLKANY